MSSSRTHVNTRSDYAALTRDIIARLDILAQYTALGLTFHKHARPSGTGWVQRHDGKGFCSDGVNVVTGKFKDFNGGEKAISLFDYAVRVGRCANFLDAKRYYARIAGVPWPGSDQDCDQRPLPSMTTVAKPKVTKPKKVTDYTEFVPQLVAHAIVNGDHAWLARNLNVGEFALRKLNVGTWDQADRSYFISWGDDPCTIWPEYHWTGKKLIPISFNRRSRTIRGDAGKKVIAGGVRGMTIADGWIDRANKTGNLIITDGGSDTAAATTMGLAAIGSPQSGSVVVRDHIVPMLLAAIRAGKLRADVTVFVTQDVNSDGGHDEGTAAICQWVADALGRPCWRRLCPSISEAGGDIAKDVRAWLTAKLPNAHEIAEGEADSLGLQFLQETIGHPTVTWPKSRVFHPSAPAAVAEIPNCQTPPPADPTPSDLEQIAALGMPGETTGNHSVYEDSSDIHTNTTATLALYKRNTERATVAEAVTEGVASPEKVYSVPFTESVLDGLVAAPTPDPAPVVITPPRLWTEHEFDDSTISRLRTLSHVPCPRKGHKVCSHKHDSTISLGIETTCMGWRCKPCLPRRRLKWCEHVRKIMSGGVTPLTQLYVWRGARDVFDRCGRKHINRHNGHYIRVEMARCRYLVVSNVDLGGARPITPVEADRQLSRVIAAYKPTAGGPKRLYPVRASDAWEMHERSSGQFAMECSFDWPLESHGVLEAMGVQIKQDGKFWLYTKPDWWSFTDGEHALIWAKCELVPPGWRPGKRAKMPVPDPADLAWVMCNDWTEGLRSYWDAPDDTPPSRP